LIGGLSLVDVLLWGFLDGIYLLFQGIDHMVYLIHREVDRFGVENTFGMA
jgi:hypothetical protein